MCAFYFYLIFLPRHVPLDIYVLVRSLLISVCDHSLQCKFNHFEAKTLQTLNSFSDVNFLIKRVEAQTKQGQ